MFLKLLLVVARSSSLLSVSVARSGPARSSRRGVKPKEIRAQAREVRMASSAPRADQEGAQDPRRPRASQRRMTTAVSLSSRVIAWPVRDEPTKKYGTRLLLLRVQRNKERKQERKNMNRMLRGGHPEHAKIIIIPPDGKLFGFGKFGRCKETDVREKENRQPPNWKKTPLLVFIHVGCVM